MSKTIEISRELLELALEINGIAAAAARYEIRQMLAAPVVERQEPIGWVSFIGNGFIRVRCSAPPALESPLYTSPPAPVVVLPNSLISNWANAEYKSGWNACLHKIKELNQ